MTLPDAPAAPGLQAVAQALLDRRTSAVELTQAALARITALEPRLQAFTHLDAARAIAHAQAIDGLRAAGVNLGPLMGLPVAVKDLFSVDGMPTTAAGLAGFTVGSDTGGSVRWPAALCAVVGYKPL